MVNSSADFVFYALNKVRVNATKNSCAVSGTFNIMLSDLRPAQRYSNAKDIERQRVKRSTPPLCPCNIDVNGAGLFYLYLYPNGRCYAEYKTSPINYTAAQALCKVTALPHVGRLATFDSAFDYNQVVSEFLTIPSGMGTDFAWIGLNNGQWIDASGSSCTPPLNLTDFQSNQTIIVPTNGTVSVGPGWNQWNFNQSLSKIYICEIGN